MVGDRKVGRPKTDYGRGGGLLEDAARLQQLGLQGGAAELVEVGVGVTVTRNFVALGSQAGQLPQHYGRKRRQSKKGSLALVFGQKISQPL